MDASILSGFSFRCAGTIQGDWMGESGVVLGDFEVREDAESEYYHLITLWKATKRGTNTL
jgi:hypothetical protein